MESGFGIKEKLLNDPGQLRRERAADVHDIYNNHLIHSLNKVQETKSAMVTGENVDSYSESDGSPFPQDTWPTDESTMIKLSHMHGRSVEPIWSGGIVWKDKFGTPYSSISYKGWLAPNPSIYRDALGYHTKGMFEIDYPERVAMISKKMRKNGLPTERNYFSKKS